MKLVNFISTFVACFWVVTSEIVTKPSNELVPETFPVVLNCSTNLTGVSIRWRFTPLRSNKSIDVYSRGEFTVYNSVVGHYDLFIENVVARYAGTYECSEEPFGDSASSELNVVANTDLCFPKCHYVNNVNATETELTCNVSIAGKLDPDMKCFDDSEYYFTEKLHRYDNVASEEGYVASYLSLKAPLSPTTDETEFFCGILLEDYMRMSYISVTVEHKRPPKENETVSVAPDEPASESVRYILLSLIILVVVATGVITAWYVVSRRSSYERKRASEYEPLL